MDPYNLPISVPFRFSWKHFFHLPQKTWCSGENQSCHMHRRTGSEMPHLSSFLSARLIWKVGIGKLEVSGVGSSVGSEESFTGTISSIQDKTVVNIRIAAATVGCAQKTPGPNQEEYVAVGARGSNDRTDKRRAYECPYCHVTIYSTVESGNVKAAGHCGKQFRVRSGVVVRAFTHACPKCGQQIQSANPSGRIKHTHKRPDGKTCPRTSWVIK